MTGAEFQDYIDQNLAQTARVAAEIIVLRRFLAQLYANCSPTPLDRVEMFDLMARAVDQLEQRFLEKAESQNPEAVARIDQWRESAPETSENLMPPVW